MKLLTKEQIQRTEIIKDEAAIQKLSDMGLSYEIFCNAAIEGYRQKQKLSHYAPPLFKGLAPWGYTAISLREQLIKKGWSYNDEYNLNRTIDPKNNFAIVISSGNAGVGKLGYNPSTMNKKGELSEVLAEVNNERQLSLFVVDSPKRRKYNIQNMLHWFFLYYNDIDKIWIELATPRALDSNGRISTWFQRIILPPINLLDKNLDTTNTTLPQKPLDDIEIRKKY